MSNPVSAFKTWLASALPTEAELTVEFEQGMAWWDAFLGTENNNDDV